MPRRAAVARLTQTEKLVNKKNKKRNATNTKPNAHIATMTARDRRARHLAPPPSSLRLRSSSGGGSRLTASTLAPEGTQQLRDAVELGTAQPPRKTDELRSNNKARREICGVVAVRGINLR